ncbi:hypothetical protein PINS_up005516 [Pythium insidiosum]|nr:hypothetical protein PINS_up005516 [Pythium insidiosum]
MDTAMVNSVAHARDIAARAAARVEAEVAKKTKSRQPNRIYEGDTVICETSDGRIFFQEVKANCTIRVGKKLTPLKPVIGAFYGSIFEEQNKKLVAVSGGLFPDPVAPETGEFEVPDTDNRNYTDTNSAQKLSVHDITGMRESGASGREIIQKLVENSETWDAKTEFSKQKYLKKKQQKYMPRVRFLKCTADSLCRTYRAKNPSKICNIREDSLGQILMYANIHAEAQVLVVDTCMGLVTGAIAERQAGLGRIIAGYEGQQLAADILRRFNFDKSTMESIHTFPLNSVQYLEMKEEDIPESEQVVKDRLSEEEKLRLEAERVAEYTEEEQEKYYIKKARRAAEKMQRQPATTVREWIRNQSDSLVIASHYDPEPVLLALLPYLKCSRPFVVYCEYMEPLTRLFGKLQQMDSVIDVQLSETWTREHQILPGRTHPEMKMNAFSGYLLTGTKVVNVDAPTLRQLESKPTMRKTAAPDNDATEPSAKRVKTDSATAESSEQ